MRNNHEKLEYEKMYKSLKKDHDILLKEATKAAQTLAQSNIMISKYRQLVAEKDKIILDLKKQLKEKEGCCFGNCKDESIVRNGEDAGGGLPDMAMYGNEEGALPEEPGQGSSEKGE